MYSNDWEMSQEQKRGRKNKCTFVRIAASLI